MEPSGLEYFYARDLYERGMPKWMIKVAAVVGQQKARIREEKNDVVPGDFLEDKQYREQFITDLRKELLGIGAYAAWIPEVWFCQTIAVRRLRNIEALLMVAVVLLAAILVALVL